MFTLFKKEENFQEENCFAAFDEYIRHNAQSGTMSNGDWRMAFCNFEKCILPFIIQAPENAELILLLWRDIVRYLYTKKTHTLTENQEFCVKVFVFGCLAVNRWGKNIAGLHFHELWIHIKKAVLEIIRKTVLGDVVRESFQNTSSTHKSQIEKLLKDVPLIPSVIPKALLTHQQYSQWVPLFEATILKSNYSSFQKFEFNGHIIHTQGAAVTEKLEKLFEKCILLKPTTLKGKSKCPNCKSTEHISEECVIGCCSNCCEEASCAFHIKQKKKSLERLNKQAEKLNSVINSSQSQTQANATQDVSTPSQSLPPTQLAQVMNPPIIEQKKTCANPGCHLVKVSGKCKYKMCKKCCDKCNVDCIYHIKQGKSKPIAGTSSEKQM
ncbi:hypothetical protein FDP41_013149 [Naegleria fowleri]|uniref:Uncharacterized protein n=1 Tax=Naegleria fowleri TaxID=5763 RepID=A0A6A5BZ42_NAEFO|nr:uncharacterized protein FDP41_013149 [Naegleria fowleri]KAF0980666.1 hypothetical protein FDP41_013149 [Naegleria fowleri]